MKTVRVTIYNKDNTVSRPRFEVSDDLNHEEIEKIVTSKHPNWYCYNF